jgi:hypothetical protein
MANQNFSDMSWRGVMSYTGAASISFISSTTLFRASSTDCPTCCPGVSSLFSFWDDAEAPPGEA